MHANKYILKHLVTICKDAFKIWGQEGVVGIPEALILNCLPASCVIPNPLDQVSSVFALPSDLGLEVGGVASGPGADLEFVNKFTRPNFWAKEFYTLKTRKSKLCSPAISSKNASLEVI